MALSGKRFTHDLELFSFPYSTGTDIPTTNLQASCTRFSFYRKHVTMNLK